MEVVVSSNAYIFVLAPLVLLRGCIFIGLFPFFFFFIASSSSTPLCLPFSFPFFFRKASQQDHPHASFNLAVGKLKNMTGSMTAGDVEMLLSVAARQGIQEAQELLENVIWTKSKLLPTKRRGSFYKH
uniref:Uncharacterized protein n=1 Tax=Sus scrofa TaxID=9823 RepID=A0A8D1F2X3_PIG